LWNLFHTATQPMRKTPYQIIESVARYAGYLVYQDMFGRLVLGRIGASPIAARPSWMTRGCLHHLR
jgi:hypothetical protein